MINDFARFVNIYTEKKQPVWIACLSIRNHRQHFRFRQGHRCFYLEFLLGIPKLGIELPQSIDAALHPCTSQCLRTVPVKERTYTHRHRNGCPEPCTCSHGTADAKSGSCLRHAEGAVLHAIGSRLQAKDNLRSLLYGNNRKG